MMNQDNVTTLPGASDQPVRQQRPDFTPAGFGRRLIAGLDELQVPEVERAAVVAKAGGVTIRTARRYLKGTSQPRGTFDQKLLAEGLGLNCSWLIFEHLPITAADVKDEREFLESVKSNPPWRQRLMKRTLTRMVNKSPRVQRLLDLHESGQLSADDFLRLAGR